MQTENGLGQQREVCRRFAEAKGMMCLEIEQAAGISGYQTEDRDDLERILARKRAGENFSVVVVHDYSRLTRGGVDHGSHLLWQFAQVGLRVVSATNDIPDNEYAPIIRALEFIKDKGYSEKTALNTARGRMAAIMDGRSTHCGQPPFAVDRMYMSDKGQKLFRIRNLPDGRQHKLPPEGEEVLLVFEANQKQADGSVLMRHYKKQPYERVTLVPGDEEDVETVRYILRRFYVDGVGTPTITCELNTMGRRSNNGGLWNISSVFDAVYQPVYVGRGICNFLDEADIYTVKQALDEFFAKLDVNLLAIRSFVDRRLKEMLSEDTDVQELTRQRQTVANELSFCTSELAVLGPELLKKKIDPLKARLIGLNTRIEIAKRARTGLTGDTDEIVRAVADELRRASNHLDDTTTPAFRSIVSALTRTVVDLDQRTAEVEVRVPISFLADPKGANLGDGCLGSPPLPTCRTQTPVEDAIILGKLRCAERRQGRKPCLACVRHAA